MDIPFSSDKLPELCTDTMGLKKKYGSNQLKKLRRRLDDLQAAAILEDCRSLPGRCHESKGDRAGQIAMALDGGFRLVFEPGEKPRASERGWRIGLEPGNVRPHSGN